MMQNEVSLDVLTDPLFKAKEIHLSVLRLDKLHPFISGNKWYKLKYNLDAFNKSGKTLLLTFGGAFSNHLVATAAAGNELNIATAAIVRGNELNEKSNPALQYVSGCGMKLIFVSRDEYRKMRMTNSIPEQVFQNLSISSSELFVIPEGGSNDLAVKGCEEIVACIKTHFDFIACAAGTGTTLAGISKAIHNNQQALGFPVVKGISSLKSQILTLNGGKKN